MEYILNIYLLTRDYVTMIDRLRPYRFSQSGKEASRAFKQPIFQKQSVIQRLVTAMNVKQHSRVSGYFSIYSRAFFSEASLRFNVLVETLLVSFNTAKKYSEKYSQKEERKYRTFRRIGSALVKH